VTREETERALLEFADFVHQTTIYVIGSQAVYGAYPDFELDVVLASKDIDVFTIPYLERWWLPVIEQFGSDSDFDIERGYYVDMVKPELPRLPLGWEGRAVRRVIGTIVVGARSEEVTAVYPEIHDLAASKIAIGRDQDLAFLSGLIESDLVQRDLLEDRLRDAPRMDKERLDDSIERLHAAFDSTPQQ
jgi:hypothetical protein